MGSTDVFSTTADEPTRVAKGEVPLSPLVPQGFDCAAVPSWVLRAEAACDALRSGMAGMTDHEEGSNG